MADRALSMAQDHAPWRPETPWWVTGIQAILLIVVGLYFLLAPSAAAGLLIQVIAVVLLVESILHILAELRLPRAEANPWTLLQAGIGATVGVQLVLQRWILPELGVESARNILAYGLIAYAVVGLVGPMLGGESSEGRMRGIVGAVLLVVLALLLLTSNESNAADRLGLLGWVSLIGGVAFLYLAWRAHKRPKPQIAYSDSPPTAPPPL
jgi:uncharacterized membrane protein HdeD (DUF308 family)